MLIDAQQKCLALTQTFMQRYRNEVFSLKDDHWCIVQDSDGFLDSRIKIQYQKYIEGDNVEYIHVDYRSYYHTIMSFKMICTWT